MYDVFVVDDWNRDEIAMTYVSDATNDALNAMSHRRLTVVECRGERNRDP